MKPAPRDNGLDLQRIDMNCNDCAFLDRWFGTAAIAATNAAGKPTVFHGHCRARAERVMFMPATCMPSNAPCFLHRRDQQ